MSNPDQPDLNTLTDDEAFALAMADDPTPPAEDAVAPPAENTDQPPLDIDESADQPPIQDDPLAALPEDIRNRITESESANRKLQAELAQARNDHAAMAGKLRPLQQQLAKLEPKQSAPSVPAATAAPLTADELDAQLETPEFKEWATTFPEEAKVWRANQRRIIEVAEKIAERRVTEAVQKLTGRIDPTLGRVEEQYRAAERNARVAELTAVHPDWQEHSASQDFSDWFNNEYLPAQPDVVQAQFADDAVVANALSQPKFAIRVLTEFKRDRGLTNAQPVTPPAPQPGAPRQATPARLALSVSPSTPAPPPVPRQRLDTMTPDQAFLAGFNATD